MLCTRRTCGTVAVFAALLATPLAAAQMTPAAEAVARLFCPADAAAKPPKRVSLEVPFTADYLAALDSIGLYAELSLDEEQPVEQRGTLKATFQAIAGGGPDYLLGRVKGRQNRQRGSTEAFDVVPNRLSPGDLLRVDVRLRKYEALGGCVEVFVAVFDPATVSDDD